MVEANDAQKSQKQILSMSVEKLVEEANVKISSGGWKVLKGMVQTTLLVSHLARATRADLRERGMRASDVLALEVALHQYDLHLAHEHN